MSFIDLDRVKKFINDMNSMGVPLFMLRDPKTGQGSVTLTSYWISFNFCLLCGVCFLGMAISKLTGVFSAEQEAMDAIKNASQYALELFMACAALYLGRKLQRNEKGALNIDDDSKKSD